MVPHRHVLPVGQQRILWVAEHLAHVPGVVLAGVEIRVIAHLNRHVHVHLVHRHQARRVGVASVTQLCTVRVQQRLNALAQRDGHRLPELHQRVQNRCSQHLRVDLHIVQETQGMACAQVHDMVAQTHPRTGAAAWGGEDAKRQIGEREIVSCRHVNP